MSRKITDFTIYFLKDKADIRIWTRVSACCR